MRDVVALERIGEAGSSASSEKQSSSSPNTSSSNTSSVSPKGTVNSEETQENRRKRKRPRAAEKKAIEEEEREDKLLKNLADGNDRMAAVIDKMQEAQAQQMEIMTGFMKAMTEMMNNIKA